MRNEALRPILDVARDAGLDPSDVTPWGRHKAKISLDALTRRAGAPTGRLVLVSAINPTPAGEGKTTTSVGLATLWVGHRLLKIPLGLLAGILAGLQTQPAVLAFAQEQTRNDLPNVGYATVFPTAMILKIALAQLFLAW